MRIVLVILAVLVTLSASQQTEISDLIHNVKERAKDEAKKTAENITEKSEKLSKDLSDKSTSIFGDISSFVSGVLSDIGKFLKMLFGDNTPGQPALPASAGSLAQIPSSRVGQKMSMLAALAVLSFLSARVVKDYMQHKEKQEDMLGGYYRNIQVLEENFL